MKTRIIVISSILAVAVIFCSVVCGVCVESPSAISADEIITVMTFNVRVDTNPLDPNGKKVPYDTVAQRSELIVQHVNDGDADIICFQEWMTSHESTVWRELKYRYNMIAVSRHPTYKLDEKCAILYDKNRFTLVETNTFWLSETPETPSIGWDAKYYRICTTAVLYDKITEKTFRVSNTHLETTGVAQEKGRRLVVDYTVNSEEPAILCGDFNFDNRYSFYRLTAYKLDDSRTLAPDSITTASYNAYHKIFLKTGGHGYPLDHIFLQKDKFTVHSYEVLNYLIDGKFSSDHFPVVAKISIND